MDPKASKPAKNQIKQESELRRKKKLYVVSKLEDCKMVIRGSLERSNFHPDAWKLK